MSIGNLVKLNGHLLDEAERIGMDAIREAFHVWEDGKMEGNFVLFVSEYIDDYWNRITEMN